MVDFTKRLGGRTPAAPTDPIALYRTLDRAHDKGPLRPAQEAVLQEWFTSRLKERDVIVKLHTGQGKTLVGLLMLQSRLNAGAGPALYLCPDNFLIAQTCDQARLFGIKTCTAEPDLPHEFLNSRAILVTSVQKLFNGLSRFGLNRDSVDVGTLLMDDAHACSDAIREQCRMRIPREDPAYHSIRTLFEGDLEHQGVGTFADICNDKRDAFLAVPYWAWADRETDVARILSQASARDAVRYAWPILKNMLSQCQCIISGAALEIEPHVAPLHEFGSYWRSPHRIFMSATVTNDAFLVKGLQLKPEAITNPLTYKKETWSGEKMVLLPSLMNDELHRGTVVRSFAKPQSARRHGVVALVPSFAASRDWASYGAIVADRKSVLDVVEGLKRGECDKTVVLANRYDGIDLPDDACRILVFDGKPYSESLVDLYQEACRPDSEATLMRTVRTIEQGMGRSVRGEKDYSVVIIVASDLTRLVREKKSRKYLSPQMAAQIEIGLEVSDMAADDIKNGKAPLDALLGLVNQSLLRDPGWKEFYTQQMDMVVPGAPDTKVLSAYKVELSAEQLFSSGKPSHAVAELQKALDAGVFEPSDRGWYLQEMARYQYRADRTESARLQVAAHAANRFLLMPAAGVAVTKLTLVSQDRMERIIRWVRSFGNYEQLNVMLSDIFGRLAFGVKADKFEQALHELSEALGFAGERPDKEWKEGPDNLWALNTTHYLLWECKNEVDLDRAEINKREAEQMNRSVAWFQKHYPGMQAINVMVHPTSTVESAAAFLQPVVVMRQKELNAFIKRVRGFFKAFETQDFSDLSTTHVQHLIDHYQLGSGLILEGVSKPARDAL